MKKSRLGQIAVAAALAVLIPWTARGQVKQYRAGDGIVLTSALSLRVMETGLEAFKDASLTGTGRAFELAFDKEPGRIIVLEPWTDPANTGVVLLVGTKRIPPKALAIRRPDKLEREVIFVEKLERNRENGRGSWFGFAASPNVQFLFDYPQEAAAGAATLVVEVLVDGKPPAIRVEVIK